jgi:capsular exopolysaccharide synthesis family protein
LRDTIRDSGEQLVRDTSWAKSYTDSQGKMIESDAVAALKKIASSGVRTGTSLIALTVTTAKPEDARDIVNAIHSAYWRDLAKLTTAAQTERLEPLSKRYQTLRDEITRIDNQMQQIRTLGGITADTIREDTATSTVNALQGPINEIRARLEGAKSNLKRLEDMIKASVIAYGDDLKESVERDPTINELKSRVSALTAEKEQLLQSGKMPGHKSVMEITNRLDANSKELELQRDTLLRKLFNAQVETYRREVDSNQAQLTDLTAKFDAAVKRKEAITQDLARLDSLGAEQRRLSELLTETRRDMDQITLAQQLSKSDRINRLRRLEEGRKPDVLYFPQMLIMLPLGVVLCVSLVGGAIFLRELLDQRVKGPSDVTMIPRVRLLGIVPLASEDPTRPVEVATAFRDAPTGAISEGFRQIRAPLTKRMQQAGYKSLLVVGGMPEAGATSVVSNLAMGAAASELKVLMIDANFRRPGLHRVFKLGEGPGLGDVLNKKTSLDAAVQATSMPNLHLLAAGTAASRSVPERLGTESMSQLVREASDKYDLVIIDTAPAVVAGDGQALANRCDACLLVVRAHSDKRGLVARMRDQLSDVRAEFLGVVVNAVKASAGGYMRKNIKAAQEYQAGVSSV